MKTHFIYGVIVAILASNASAIEVNGDASLGYDSNPYRLADNLDNDEAWYVDTNIFATQKFGAFDLSGYLKNRKYENSFNDADVFLGRIKGRYIKRYTILDKRVYSSISLATGLKDKIYVSRTTGSIGTFGGQKIDDRYDYDYWKVSAYSSIKLNQQLSTAITFSYNNKSYDDQNIAGLSNLDQEQVNLLNTWNFEHTQASKFKLVLGVGERDYDNKRQKTKAGALVPGSNLKYYYHNIRFSHEYDITSNLSTDLEIKYEERTDNGPGYYDTDKITYSADVYYTVNDSVKLFAKTSYQDYEYLHSSSTDENDEDLPGKQGYSAEFGAEKDLSHLTSLPTTGFIGIQFDDYSSDDPIYEYDRYQAFMGIKLSFK